MAHALRRFRDGAEFWMVEFFDMALPDNAQQRAMFWIQIAILFATFFLRWLIPSLATVILAIAAVALVIITQLVMKRRLEF